MEEQRARDLAELVAVQEAAELDLLSDGLLAAQDLFRPLAEATDGLEARPLTRFLDTNTFYRAILVEGQASLTAPLAPPQLPPGRWVATLPAPFAFSRAARRAVAAGRLAADVLGPQIDAWAQAGCALVVLADPFLPVEPDAVDEAVSALRELPHSVPVALQLVFGDATPLLGALADAPVDAVGVDFYRTPLAAVPEGYPKEILAGVVDSRSSALEDPAEIGRFARELAARRPARLSLIPNGDLQFVPERIAREKIARLGRARVSLRAAA